MKAWEWLKDASNRTVLAFLGGGLVALVAVLEQAGMFERSPPAAEPSSPASAYPAASDAAASTGDQAAVATDGAVSANVRGDGNRIQIEKGR